jgi:glutamyl-tRNA reductase
VKEVDTPIMPILITGLRYTTASLNVREQIAFSEAELPYALRCLKAFPAIEEAGILTTCNRVELHLKVSSLKAGKQAVASFFQAFKQFDVQQYKASLFGYVEEDAIRHLFSVASGLDSLIVGEGQILGQVRDAFELAQKTNTIGKTLHQLYTSALHTGKLVRTETGIASRDTSVSSSAYQLAKRLDDTAFNQRRFLVVGGGKMAELLLEKLKQDFTLPHQKNQVAIVNRSPQRLQYLHQKFGFSGHSFEGLATMLPTIDTIFVATAAPHALFYPEHFTSVQKSIRIFDISVPRNVHDSVGALPHISLHNTDDLAGIGDFCPETEALIRHQAEGIIETAYWEFRQWQQIRTVVQPTLVSVRQQAEIARQEALAKATQLSGEDLAEWSRLLMNKVLHAPSVALRQQGHLHLPSSGQPPLHSIALPPPPTPIAIGFANQLDWAM